MGIQTIVAFSEALTYFQEQLSEGTTLANRVLATLDCSGGKFLAAMPEGVDQGKPLNLRYWNSTLSRNEYSDFARMIKSFIKTANNAVLLQDTVEWNSEHSEYVSRAVKYREELYWNLVGPDISETDLLNLIRTPILPYPFCAFFYTRALSPTSNQLDDDDLRQVVDSLVGAAVGAFDMDSFLIWWRHEVPVPVD